MKLLKIIFLLILPIILIGCSAPENVKHPILPSADAQFSRLNRQLLGEGVKIVHKGDDIGIILPSKLLFNQNSANLTADAYPILDDVVEFINHYEKSVVAVTGYGYSQTISGAQAHKIVQYLWHGGIGANFVYALGENAPLDNCVLISFRRL